MFGQGAQFDSTRHWHWDRRTHFQAVGRGGSWDGANGCRTKLTPDTAALLGQTVFFVFFLFL